MLSGNCTEALSIQASVRISGSSANLIKNDIAPLPFPLPALLKQYWYIKRGERVRVRGHAPFYATLGCIKIPLAVSTTFRLVPTVVQGLSFQHRKIEMPIHRPRKFTVDAADLAVGRRPTSP